MPVSVKLELGHNLKTESDKSWIWETSPLLPRLVPPNAGVVVYPSALCLQQHLSPFGATEKINKTPPFFTANPTLNAAKRTS